MIQEPPLFPQKQTRGEHGTEQWEQNMNKNNTSSSSGIGFSGLLFIAFLVLKLTNTINWSWWWITAPLWIPVILIALGIFIAYKLSK